MKFELEEYHRNALEKFVEYINQEKIPIIENGGESVLGNLQTLCSVCNIGKSNI